MSTSTLGMTEVLKVGSRGRDVRLLQRLLKAVTGDPLVNDGIFGGETESSVRRFQRQAGIGVDGIAGPNTFRKLERELAKKNAPTESLKLGHRGDSVRNLQNWLNAKSPAGPGLVADGVFGHRTQTAVFNFQRHAGLTIDGIAGPDTLSALISAPAVQQSPRLPKSPDPETTTPANVVGRPTYSQIVSVYGDPEDWSYITRISPPFPLYYDGSPVSSVAVHKKVADSLSMALSQILAHYGLEEIEKLRINHNYGGSVNKRVMRGGTQWSTHSWGVAIDLNASENRLNWGRDKALFAKPEYKKMIDIFEQNGWYSLGRHKNYDYMHFQAVKV